ncbi:cytosine-specific methyltransferase, partial [Genlisea aurea]
QNGDTHQVHKKRSASKINKNPNITRKRPKRAASCTAVPVKTVRISEKDSLIEIKKDTILEEEALAVRLTAGQEDGRPCRRLTDFIFHNSQGVPQPFEMSEVDNIFISGVILPNDEISSDVKPPRVRCEGFGRIEEWSISGYEDGSPVVWISTEIADYDCLKPSGSYKKYYDHFYAKASVCVEAYKKLTKSSGGDPDISLDELLAGLTRSLNGMKCFSSGISIKDFIVSQGDFIYNQLVGLDVTSRKSDQLFIDLPCLIALKNERSNLNNVTHALPDPLSASLTIKPKSEGDKITNGASVLDEDDEDAKIARLLQEEEMWHSMKQKKSRVSANSSSKYYVKINEDEIANDYPLPVFYEASVEEIDEYILFESGFEVQYVDDLPRSMLDNWVLYNSDGRLVPLELLPLKPCDDIDVTIFGSGIMTVDDGSGYMMDSETMKQSSSSSHDSEGVPIFLSAIKEWMIEFGSSMVSISIRTDMSWYRLGKPLKQYAPWYNQVLKTAKLAISTITLLKEQSRVSKLSFSDVIRRISNFTHDHPAFISSKLEEVERYVVVHGQIIMQQFSEYPDDMIKKCAFVAGLVKKMEEKHHTKWLVKKKKLLQREVMNFNPRAGMAPVVSKRKAMQATTTRLINRIWGGYYSNYIPEEANEGDHVETKEDVGNEDQDEAENDDMEEKVIIPQKLEKSHSSKRQVSSVSGSRNVLWEGESVGKLPTGEFLYERANVRGDQISVKQAVLLLENGLNNFADIYFVEYMFEKLDGAKMFHGRLMQRGCHTVLGNAASERELFLTNECENILLEEVMEKVKLDITSKPWGHHHRKEATSSDKIERARAEEMKKKGLPLEYYCKSLYWPERGAFFVLPYDLIGLGSGNCHSCKIMESENVKEKFLLDKSLGSFTYRGIKYSIDDYVYATPSYFSEERESELFKGGRNVGLKAYVVCQLLEIVNDSQSKRCDASSVQVKVRRFFRPEDVSIEKAYSSDIYELYYSDEIHTIPVDIVEGKCEIRRKKDFEPQESASISDHVFYCEYQYDPSKGSLKKVLSHIKFSPGQSNAETMSRKKGKWKEGEAHTKSPMLEKVSERGSLATLDVFSGCGGLSEGLQQSGICACVTKWAIEYDKAAADAFKLNHPEASVFISNCNVILRAVMQKCGDVDDCISTPEAAELAALLSQEEIDNLPLPGQVDFINGGPPCQGFSGMNRFNQSTWSKVQCEMILAFLSFADYYRPKFFLLENVRNFVSFNRGQTFRLTLASLLEMGYQVRFGILEAGAYGVPQSRKRAFIWAASPDEILPEWPEPVHVFAAPELRISLSRNSHYSAVRSTSGGAPFRSLTVRDTIHDLPPVTNGASKTSLEYAGEPVSWFQKKIRGSMDVLRDHISKEMNELNLIRCGRIPKRPGADWRDLPNEKVKLSTGQVVDLIPWCLPNTAERHNQWKGLFGRLDWEGNFPTSITDPQPMGKVGMCFHPEQDRIVTVRECARSQGFPDSYIFSGNILEKHRQIGNAVPPPLAFALGRKLREA